MPTVKITIANRLGLHARAAAKFVQTASRFPCDVTVNKNGNEINGKSILGVMMLAAPQGAEIEITTNGAQEDAALTALAKLVHDCFGEPQ